MNIMICVTQQKTCERLIKAGVRLQEKHEGDIFVVHVAPEGWKILGNSKEGEALDYLFDISKKVGANMTVLRSKEVIKTILEFCQKHSIGSIILGESREKSTENNLITKLSKKIPSGVELQIIPTD